MSVVKLNDIQWLRAIAAIEVIIWHSDLIAKHFSSWAIHESVYKPLGGFGVELFFIISGYVICMRAPVYKTPFDFMLSRIYRLFPLYWLFTTLVLVAYLIGWNLHGLKPEPLHVLKSYFILPQQAVPVFGLGWTLELEMVFYAIVAVVALMAGGLNGRTKVGIAVLLGVLGLVGFIIGTGISKKVWDLHLMSPYLLAFGFGWMVRVVEEEGGWHKNAMLAVMFGLMFLPTYFIADPLDTPIVYRMAVAAGLFALFRYWRDIFEVRNGLNQAMALVGDASYSLYLSHWFVLSIIGKILGVIDPPAALDLPVRLFGVAASIACGVLLFLVLEKPVDRFLRGTQRDRITMALAGSSTRS